MPRGDEWLQTNSHHQRYSWRGWAWCRPATQNSGARPAECQIHASQCALCVCAYVCVCQCMCMCMCMWMCMCVLCVVCCVSYVVCCVLCLCVCIKKQTHIPMCASIYQHIVPVRCFAVHGNTCEIRHWSFTALITSSLLPRRTWFGDYHNGTAGRPGWHNTFSGSVLAVALPRQGFR